MSGLKTRFTLGVLFSVIQSLVVASIAIIIKQSVTWIDIATLILVQNVICFLVVSAMNPGLLKNGFKTKHYTIHLVRAFFGIGIYLFYYKALQLIPSVSAVLFLHTAPIFIPFLEWIRSRQKPKAVVLIALCLGFFGLFLVLGLRANDFSNLIGGLCGILSGFCFAATFPLTSTLRQSDSILKIIFLYSFHSILALGVYIFFRGSFAVSQAFTWVYILLGLLYFIQMYLVNCAISLIGTTKSGVLTNLSVVFVLLLNYFNGAQISLPIVLGVSLVSISSYLILKNKEDTQSANL